jgi:hypothetical protein
MSAVLHSYHVVLYDISPQLYPSPLSTFSLSSSPHLSLWKRSSTFCSYEIMGNALEASVGFGEHVRRGASSFTPAPMTWFLCPVSLAYWPGSSCTELAPGYWRASKPGGGGQRSEVGKDPGDGIRQLGYKSVFHTSELHERPWEPTQAPCLSTGGSCPPPGNHHQDGPTSVQNPKWPHSGPREQGCSSAQNPVVVADWCDSGAGFMLGEHIPKVLGGRQGLLEGLVQEPGRGCMK